MNNKLIYITRKVLKFRVSISKREVKNMANLLNTKAFCSKIYKKEGRKFYSKIDIHEIADVKIFWKTITCFLLSKVPSSSRFILNEKETVIFDD